MSNAADPVTSRTSTETPTASDGVATGINNVTALHHRNNYSLTAISQRYSQSTAGATEHRCLTQTFSSSYAVVIGATNWPRNYHLHETCFLAPVCADEFWTVHKSISGTEVIFWSINNDQHVTLNNWSLILTLAESVPLVFVKKPFFSVLYQTDRVPKRVSFETTEARFNTFPVGPTNSVKPLKAISTVCIIPHFLHRQHHRHQLKSYSLLFGPTISKLNNRMQTSKRWSWYILRPRFKSPDLQACWTAVSGWPQ